MAQSPFIDYTEVDPKNKPGLYHFRDSQGGGRLLYGSAAQQIKDNIDRDKNSALGALGSGKMSPDEWNAMALAPESASPSLPEAQDQRTARRALPASHPDYRPPEQRPSVPESKSDVTYSDVPQLTEEQLKKYRQPEPTPQAGAGPGRTGSDKDFELAYEDDKFQWYIKPGTDGKNPGDIIKVRKGSPGSPGSPGGWREMSATVQGGHPVNESLIGQMGLSSAAREEVIDEQSAAAQLEAAEMQKQAIQEEERNNIALRQAYQREQDAKQFADQARSEFDRYQQQIDTSQIDPNRIYSGAEGKAREVRHRIKSIFGAFGATLAKSPNFVAERIARMKEDDINAQEKEMFKTQGQRDSALAHFRNLTGDLETAKHAVRALQSNRNVIELRKIEAMAKTPQIKAAAKAAMANEQESYERALDAYYRSAEGIRSVSLQNLMPRPGTPGRAPQKMAPTLEERGKIIANSKPGEGGKESSVLAQQWGTLQNLEDMVAGYKDDYVPPLTENRWAPGRIGEAVVDFGFGKGTFNRNMYSPEANKAMQDAASFDTQLAQSIAASGGAGALGDQERIAYQRGTAPGATMGERKRAVAIAKRALERKARSIGMSPEQLIGKYREPAP